MASGPLKVDRAVTRCCHRSFLCALASFEGTRVRITPLRNFIGLRLNLEIGTYQQNTDGILSVGFSGETHL